MSEDLLLISAGRACSMSIQTYTGYSVHVSESLLQFSAGLLYESRLLQASSWSLKTFRFLLPVSADLAKISGDCRQTPGLCMLLHVSA